MNILFMADVPADPNSGAAGTEYQTIESLRRLGHQVDTVWADGLSHRVKHGNLHYLVELPSSYRRAMLKRMQQTSYDVIHVNQPHGYLAARLLSRLHKRIVFIHRSHGLELRVERELADWGKKHNLDARNLFRKAISKVLAQSLSLNSRGIVRYADGHIVSASQCRDFLHEELRVPNERIAVIPQAPPQLFLESSAPEMTASRLKRILYVGQFAFIKAPMVLAGVINKLSCLSADLEFTWVCSAKDHNQIKDILDEPARERVKLLDWMPQDKLMEIYDGHAIFLFPSFFEGFGKAFLEAMSRGLCVIAADNGGAHDVISHGIDGMLAPTGCVDSMVTHCSQLINHDSMAASISQAAAKTARAYTWDRVAAETVAFYQSRLNAKARGAL